MKKLLLLMALIISSTQSVHAKNLGTVGVTYPIKERDAQEELQEKAKAIDWKKVIAKTKPEKYRPSNTAVLPRATKNRTFLVDMTYALEMDIPDGKGGVLYPKGFSFNPLDYIPYRKTIIVIDGNDQDQVEWFAKSEYKSRNDVMFLITDGNFTEIAKKVDRPIFFATSPIVDKFMLQAVPSVIRQKFRMMEVQEILVKRLTKK